MKDFDQPGTLAPTGLFLGGTKYMVIQGEAGAVIRGKKVRLQHHTVHLCNAFRIWMGKYAIQNHVIDVHVFVTLYISISIDFYVCCIPGFWWHYC